MCRGGLHVGREVAGGVRGSCDCGDACACGPAGVPGGGGKTARGGCRCEIDGGDCAGVGQGRPETALGGTNGPAGISSAGQGGRSGALERVLASPAVQFGFRWSRP